MFNKALYSLLFISIALGCPETALAASTGLPWEAPLEVVRNSLTGPVAMTISVMGMAVTGGTLVWGGELSEFARRACMLTLAISFLVGGSSFITTVFQSAQGAVL